MSLRLHHERAHPRVNHTTSESLGKGLVAGVVGAVTNALNYFRVQCIADMAGLAASATRSRMTPCGHSGRVSTIVVVSQGADLSRFNLRAVDCPGGR